VNDKHFTVDSTLITAQTCAKTFRPKGSKLSLLLSVAQTRAGTNHATTNEFKGWVDFPAAAVRAAPR
jgi:hypothetical protein